MRDCIVDRKYRCAIVEFDRSSDAKHAWRKMVRPALLCRVLRVCVGGVCVLGVGEVLSGCVLAGWGVEGSCGWLRRVFFCVSNVWVWLGVLIKNTSNSTPRRLPTLPPQPAPTT